MPKANLYPIPVPHGFTRWAEQVLKPETLAAIRSNQTMLVITKQAFSNRKRKGTDYV